jgi:hypothetical protein
MLQSLIHPLGKGICWYLTNILFVLAPLLFLLSIEPFLIDYSAAAESEYLLRGGVVLFVNSSLMMTISIDLILGNRHLNVVSAAAFFISPFIAVITICFFYLLIILKQVDERTFTTASTFQVLFLVFGGIFSIVGKFILLKPKTI